MLEIPFKNFSSFTEDITLDGKPYIFEFNFNSRGDFWTLSMYDREQHPLLEGRKIVLNYELIKQFTDERMPPNFLFSIDPSLSNFSDLTQDDFLNGRAFLIYNGET